MIKTREFKDKNYRAIHLDWKTLRIAIDKDKPILDLDFPEFMDIKITDKCMGGCSYCYQNSLPNWDEYWDVVGKIKQYFSWMSDNEKPFQVALGWGNPNEHPSFIPILASFYLLGILPNYTTNGMGITEEILQATKKFCGWVALSCHKHLDKYRQKAFFQFKDLWIQTNLHIIISDKESIDRFFQIASLFPADYFVLLPLTAQWRCKEASIDYEYLMEVLPKIDVDKVAFGAMFYPYIKSDPRLNISLYEPEIMSKYLDLKWNWALYTSSFSDKPIKTWFFN